MHRPLLLHLSIRARFVISVIKKYSTAVIVRRNENYDMRRLISHLATVYLLLQAMLTVRFLRDAVSRRLTRK